MRFGLVGTGFWARTVHAAALSDAPDVELAGVWGRDPAKAATLAADVGVTAYDDVATLYDAVDAVAFAVPPDVQAGLAERAARAGRHLLLEKPIATRPDDADRLVGAVAGSGVSSVVFFTGRFLPELRAWVDEVRGERWQGAWAVWLGSAFASDSPFRDSPWRWDKGGLWDVGPHALAMLTATLGPVRRVTADRGTRDVVHLVLHHENAATSTVTVTLSAPPPASGSTLTLWGEPGRSTMPTPGGEAVDAYRTAVAELVAGAQAGRADHPSGVRFGARVVHLLADAERQLDRTPVADGDRDVWPDP
jgi:predicted dehydrogenase